MPIRFAAGNGTHWVAAGDLSGDGKPDIVTANNIADTISVLINNGDGTFRTHADYTGTAGLTFVLLGRYPLTHSKLLLFGWIQQRPPRPLPPLQVRNPPAYPRER
ncbi:MAG: VCBS repeat-containing protein [Acidobacteriales bacterium]|nr:VCBS repeat-containing protein [Terriglobales bacterium]